MKALVISTNSPNSDKVMKISTGHRNNDTSVKSKGGSSVLLLLSHKIHKGRRLGRVEGSTKLHTVTQETVDRFPFPNNSKNLFLLTMTMIILKP